MGALDGVKVVDFGHAVAGPLAAVLLADQGAQVVRVDRPGLGLDDPGGAFLDRGKRRITLDLASSADRRTALALVRDADVFVENFRPGVMERFGLGWRDLQELCPRLVYLSLPGFSQDDPRAGVRAFEGVIAAATDNCRPRSGEAEPGRDPDRPSYSPLPMASSFAAVLGVTGVVAALVERQESGLGQRVSAPLYDAMFEAIGNAGTFVAGQGRPKPALVGHNTFGSGTYRCRDDRFVKFSPLGGSPRFRTWFLHEVGHPEWGDLDDDGLAERLGALFRQRPAAEWERRGRDAGVPIARVQDVQEWLSSDHARESGASVVLEDPVLGPTRMAGLPVLVGHDPALPGQTVRPRRLLDADRKEILREVDAAVTDAVRTSPARPGPRPPALEGLRVLDLTQILAGPTSGRLLAELGAQVTKINAPQRWVGAHSSVNRGKDSILLGVEHPQGQEVFWRLVEESDVVVMNFPPGTAERYGIGYEAARARRPEIIYASVSCFGGLGSWAAGRGYEAQGQAVTGVMARAGGPHRPAVFGPYNLLDHGTGAMTAYAVLLGVLERTRTGTGTHVRTSLAQTGTFHQAVLTARPVGSTEADTLVGHDLLGRSPLMRYYQGRDGWFFLGATVEDRPALDTVAGLSAVRGVTDPQRLEEVLAQVFRTGSAASWVQRLRACDLGAHEVVTLAQVMTDPVNRARGLSVELVYEEAGVIRMPGVTVGLSGSPTALGMPVGPPGADAEAVLGRLGLTSSEVRDLADRWALQLENLPSGWP